VKGRIEKLAEIKKNKPVDIFLLTSPASLKYLAGYFYNFETGPSPFHLLPAALIVGDGSNLVIADNETHQLAAIESSVSVETYESYTFEKPVDSNNQFLFHLHKSLNQYTAGKTRIGIEQDFLPLVIARSLLTKYPDIELIDITSEIVLLRAIKDVDEIELIQKATHLSDVGQAAVLKYAKEGMSELELFSKVRLEMETVAGTRVPMMADFVSGKTTASGGGNPGNKVIQQNDLILCDLTPCFDGYWGDSCNTIVVGKPTAEQNKTFTLVKEALELGIHAIRPGAPAKDVDQVMRSHLEAEGSFGHHGGHGVGLFYHEEPRIVPYNTMILEPGMVIALEPAVYKEDYGIRLEHLMLVTKDGSEVLTKFNHCFQQG
jgi:Xaa-Pro aminopeptidase